MKTLWIVTRAINQYDQDGDYFVAAFIEKPSFQELKALLPKESDKTIGKLTRGGGRQGCEDEWFYLTEIGVGQEYKTKEK
jgi:hypothetical protein